MFLQSAFVDTQRLTERFKVTNVSWHLSLQNAALIHEASEFSMLLGSMLPKVLPQVEICVTFSVQQVVCVTTRLS